MTFEMTLFMWYHCTSVQSGTSVSHTVSCVRPGVLSQNENTSVPQSVNILFSPVKITTPYECYLRRKLLNFLGTKTLASFFPIPIFKHPKGVLQSNLSLWILTTAMLCFNVRTFRWEFQVSSTRITNYTTKVKNYFLKNLLIPTA